MKWLLVVLVMNSPVKTDLIFDSLPACLAAEAQMRNAWADAYNEIRNTKGTTKEMLNILQSKMTTGTCVPSK